MNAPQTLSIKSCYSKAWASFAKWWVPICVIAGILMVFQWIPKQLAKTESTAMYESLSNITVAFEQGDYSQLEVLTEQLTVTWKDYARRVLVFSLYATPFALLLTVMLIAISLMAARNQRIKFSVGRLASVSLAHLVFAFVKMLLMFLLLPLGLFVYVKLYFVSLLMLEEGATPVAAAKESWRMTAGNFWPLFGLVALNSLLQLALIPTVIGLIPATGFASTARAAAFTILRGNLATTPPNGLEFC
jgi:uncharacterized membrane protein